MITLRPRQRMRVHVHERQEEVYVVLDGELTLIVEGDEHRLRHGQLARVGPATRRQVVNRGPEPLVLLVVGASAANIHESRDARAWQSWEESGDGRPPADVALPERTCRRPDARAGLSRLPSRADTVTLAPATGCGACAASRDDLTYHQGPPVTGSALQLLTPMSIGPVESRNRFIRSSTSESAGGEDGFIAPAVPRVPRRPRSRGRRAHLHRPLLRPPVGQVDRRHDRHAR